MIQSRITFPRPYPAFFSLPSSCRLQRSTSARTTVDIAQVGGLLSFAWSPSSKPSSSASPRQLASTTPSPFVLDDNLRRILGNNPNLSDNKLLKSWQYVFWMISYCVACTVFGLLSVTLLPDPKTLELIRSGGDDYDDMAAAAQSMSGAYEEMGDTGDYMEGYKGQGGSGSHEAGNEGSQDTKSYGMQGDAGYAMQDAGIQTSDEQGKKKTKGYTKYKDTSGEPTKDMYDHWINFYNRQKDYLTPSGEKQSGEQKPPSSHYQMIPDNTGSIEDSRQPLTSQTSSYSSYSNQAS